MDAQFDLDKIRLDPTQSVLQSANKRRLLPRHAPGQRFLKGPIPWSWLVQAARLPGKTLQVAIAAWHEAQLKRSSEATLSRAVAKELGVGRDAMRQALTRLQAAGLIHLDTRVGRSPRVTILNLTEDCEPGVIRNR